MAGEAVKVSFIEAAAPATPAASRVVVYAKADGLMYSKDDAGTETLMSSGASGTQVFPHHALVYGIYPFTTTGFTFVGVSGDDPSYTAGSQNDEAVFKVLLAAGTWRLDITHYVRTARGIYTFALSTDGSSYTDIGTVDGYAASPTTGTGTFTVSSITGITVATSGLWFFRFKMATKNASSAGYSAWLKSAGLTRTGA